MDGNNPEEIVLLLLSYITFFTIEIYHIFHNIFFYIFFNHITTLSHISFLSKFLSCFAACYYQQHTTKRTCEH